MPSQPSQLLEDTYRRMNRLLRTGNVDIDLYRILMDDLANVATEPSDVTYEEIQCPGTVRPALWCSPQSASTSHVILYLHGGGFSTGSPSSHRKLAAHLAKRAGCQALVLDYRRAPTHQFPAQIEDGLSAYKWLMHEKRFQSKNIAFAGDSAGGNLTVSVSLAARNQGIPVPAAIAAFSPWFDMRLTGESWQTNVATDALVLQDAMVGVVKTYVGDRSLDDPLLDLLHTDLTGLPPMYLTSGKAEVLQDDAVVLAQNARSAGVEVQLELAEGMQHVWVFMAGNAPEADKSLAQAAAFIRSRMSS